MGKYVALNFQFKQGDKHQISFEVSSSLFMLSNLKYHCAEC